MAAASTANPAYSVYIVSDGKKYNVTPILINLDMAESRNRISQSVTVQIMNVMVDGAWLSSVFDVRDRIYVYANTGAGSKEIFRGFIWDRDYRSSLTEREITLKCYDHLIYLQESESSEFFASGKSTKDIIGAICNEWGIKYEYDYESITHSKLVLRGSLSDIITSDVLDLVKDRTGKKYAITSAEDTMRIKTVGQNETVYKIVAGANAVSTKRNRTLDGCITKVVIYGKADKEDRLPVEASIVDGADKYGTLQKIITRSENETLEAAKEEATSILKENATPKWTYEVEAPDIPWIRKGDKVYVNAGDIQNKYLIVTELDRSIGSTSKKIILGLEDAPT